MTWHARVEQDDDAPRIGSYKDTYQYHEGWAMRDVEHQMAATTVWAEPPTYKASQTKEPWLQNAADWHEACAQEYGKIVRKKVWELVPRTDVPAGVRVGRGVWALKRK